MAQDNYCGCCGGDATEAPKGEHGSCCNELHDIKAVAPGPLPQFEYEPVSESTVPAGLRWAEDGRETTPFTEVAYAGSASGGEGSPWRRITSNATRAVEYARLAR